MFGYVRLCYNQHTVWNCHLENPPNDFRLDRPFEAQMKFADSMDLDSMNHEQHSHTPYLILYIKALEKWRNQQLSDVTMNGDDSLMLPDNFAKRKEFTKVLMSMRKPDDKGSMDEENFNEAKTNLIKSFGSCKISEHARKVFNDPKAMTHSVQSTATRSNGALECLRPFWVLEAAVHAFGFVTINYLCRSLLNRIDDPNLVEKPITIDCLVWFILLRAMDRFQMEKDRFPGTNGVPCGIDSKDLKRRVDILIAETNYNRKQHYIQMFADNSNLVEFFQQKWAEFNPTAALKSVDPYLVLSVLECVLAVACFAIASNLVGFDFMQTCVLALKNDLLFTTFGKGGLVLRCFSEGSQYFKKAVNELISTVLLQECNVTYFNRDIHYLL
ncbi:NEDD8-activating enzyme E1 regulatory subunit [Ditylenchus destructor]|nr:NEDD8-activating enzyme E1 regulatory subunit [Ditylenchus destructor]